MLDCKRWSSVSGLVLLVLAIGCAPKREPVFQPAESSKELSETHQKQIHAALNKYFGTPKNPVLKLAAATTDEAGESVLSDALEPEHLKYGAQVFLERCAGCHGETGDGQGEAAPFLQPKPRDYRKGIYKFTSTPYGTKPARNDLIRVIMHGSKGTSMPSFKFISDEEMQALVDYVIMLSQRGEVEETLANIATNDYDPEDEIEAEDFERAMTRVHDRWVEAEFQLVRPYTAQPKMTDETILAGRKAFLSRGCSKCHGTDAKGQTTWLSPLYIAEQEAKPEEEREKINLDAWNYPAPAADLTAGMLHGGRRPIDIYRRIYSGINGTPMPGFAAAFQEEPDTIWHLVHYVLSVVDGREVPGLAEVQPDPPPAEEGSAEETPADSTPTESSPAETVPAEPVPAEATEAIESTTPAAEPAATDAQTDAEKSTPDNPDASEPSS